MILFLSNDSKTFVCSPGWVGGVVPQPGGHTCLYIWKDSQGAPRIDSQTVTQIVIKSDKRTLWSTRLGRRIPNSIGFWMFYLPNYSALIIVFFSAGTSHATCGGNLGRRRPSELRVASLDGGSWTPHDLLCTPTQVRIKGPSVYIRP